MSTVLVHSGRYLRENTIEWIHRTVAIIAALLCCFPAIGACADAEPAAVRVGNIAYSTSEVQAYWNSIAQMISELGYSVTEEDIAQYRDSVLESYVSMGILENKYAEFGLDKLTDQERLALEEEAGRVYAAKVEEFVLSIAEQYGKTLEEARRFAPTFMELYGYTMDSAREESLRSLKEERILEYVTADIPMPSDADVAAYYEENYVQPSREAYANDIEAFETDVLYYGGLSYYIPEGYRYVRHILLPADPEAQTRADTEQAELAALDSALTTAYNKLYGYQALGEDTAQPQREYEELILERQAKEKQLQATLDESLLLHEDELAEIRARLEAREAFSALMTEFSGDTQMPQEGYMVCAESVLWSAAFRNAAMALTEIGSVGEPVTTSAGVHIIEYTSDVPAGAVALEGELKDEMAALALRAKQYAVLEECILQWRDEYKIEINTELMSVPEVLRN